MRITQDTLREIIREELEAIGEGIGDYYKEKQARADKLSAELADMKAELKKLDKRTNYKEYRALRKSIERKEESLEAARYTGD